MVKVKKCPRCGKTYPYTLEFFHRDRRATNGLRTTCRECNIKIGMKYHNCSYLDINQYMSMRCAESKQRAKNKNMDYDLTPEYLIELWEKQDGKCYYSGLPMTYNKYDIHLVSIDRIDSNKGYTKDNVVLSCWAINSMKNSYTTEEFVGLCQAVVDHNAP